MKRIHYVPLLTMLSLLLVVILAFSACGTTAASTTEETTQPTITTPAATTSATTQTSETAVTTTASTTAPITITQPVITTTTPITTTQVPETTEQGPEWINAVFGGGPFTTGGKVVANILKNTDYNTLMLWSVHVQSNGDLHMNDIPIVQDGKIINNNAIRTWQAIIDGCPNITRIELSIGGWGCTDFENIRDLIKKEGIGENSTLYKNFKCLMEATQADAVNYDDESCYDVSSSVEFGKLCLNLGMKVTLCPYTNRNYWQQVFTQLGGAKNVDRVYLQCYVGGAGNNPNDWARYFPSADLVLGYYNAEKTPAQVTETLKSYQKVAEGGFMWLFDEMMSNGTADDYATAIKNAGIGKYDN